MSGSVDHQVFMREAHREAFAALDRGEVPVGAVVVLEGKIVGRGSNQPITASDPTAHAEIVALRDAARRVGNYRLAGATLYVTVEPCAMCAGALVHARIGALVFGTVEPKAGAVSSAMRLLDHPSLNHRIAVIGGVLEDDCRSLLQAFFVYQRKEAKARVEP